MAFGIDDAVAAVATFADSAVKRIWPDATEVEKAKLAQLTQEMQNEFDWGGRWDTPDGMHFQLVDII